MNDKANVAKTGKSMRVHCTILATFHRFEVFFQNKSFKKIKRHDSIIKGEATRQYMPPDGRNSTTYEIFLPKKVKPAFISCSSRCNSQFIRTPGDGESC